MGENVAMTIKAVDLFCGVGGLTYGLQKAGIPVVAGLSEATAIGNIMIQALAAGTAKDIASMRQLINRSISLETFYPEDTNVWDTAYLHFKQVTMNH